MIVALTAPRLGAAAAELLPGKLQVVVICNGVTMQSILIDEAGEAVEMSEAGPCIVADLPDNTPPLETWRRLQLTWAPNTTAPHLAPHPAPLNRRPPGRAPPKPV
ncbi:MAG: hypothetical protein AAF264_08045 [Pseudomonadota bacterium]